MAHLSVDRIHQLVRRALRRGPHRAAFVCVLACGGCGGSTADDGPGNDSGNGGLYSVPPTTPSPGQQYLFEASYVNFGRSATINGVYVNSEGKVYQYDYYPSQSPDAGRPNTEYTQEMTESDVSGKYGTSPELVTTIDRDTLLANYANVGAARAGALVGRKQCSDYGYVRYVAWVYDADAAVYTPVQLGANGDLAMRNTRPEAAQLMAWLDSLDGSSDPPECGYSSSPCSETVCPGAAACRSGFVPMRSGEGSCSDDCGLPTNCTSVPDCSACTAGQDVCILDTQLGKRCSDLHETARAEWTADLSCDSAGEGICAGGKAYCRGSVAEGFSCLPP
jgi:hypothetical protein